MTKQKTFLQKFGETKYSKNVEIINALITSDILYKLKSNYLTKIFRLWMFIYAIFILLSIIVSLIVLGVPKKTVNNNLYLFNSLEGLTFFVLLFDFCLRWFTSEVKIKKGKWSYFLFPFTLTGILLIVSLLPSLTIFNLNWDHFITLKFVRIFRIVLLTNLFSGFQIFKNVILKEKKILYSIFVVVIITIVSFALVIYNAEESKNLSNRTINSFWDALYFSTITLTTIGFGDKVPTSNLGKTITMIMSLVGIAILAIPSGVIAAGFISEAKEIKNKNLEKEKYKNLFSKFNILRKKQEEQIRDEIIEKIEEKLDVELNYKNLEKDNNKNK